MEILPGKAFLDCAKTEALAPKSAPLFTGYLMPKVREISQRNPKSNFPNIMKTILSILALAALSTSLMAGEACKKCCSDKGKSCAECCKDAGKTCGKDCCKEK